MSATPNHVHASSAVLWCEGLIWTHAGGTNDSRGSNCIIRPTVRLNHKNVWSTISFFETGEERCPPPTYTRGQQSKLAWIRPPSAPAPERVVFKAFLGLSEGSTFAHCYFFNTITLLRAFELNISPGLWKSAKYVAEERPGMNSHRTASFKVHLFIYRPINFPFEVHIISTVGLYGPCIYILKLLPCWSSWKEVSPKNLSGAL